MVMQNIFQLPFKHTQGIMRIQLCHGNEQFAATHSIHADHWPRTKHSLSTRSTSHTDRDKKVVASRLPTVTWEEGGRGAGLEVKGQPPRQGQAQTHHMAHNRAQRDQQALSLTTCTILTAHTKKLWKFCKIHMGKEVKCTLKKFSLLKMYKNYKNLIVHRNSRSQRV